MTAPLLEVRNLVVHFPTADGVVKSVDGIDFTLHEGRTLCIVGESGSGKSVTTQAILGLHRQATARVSGQVLLEGEDVLTMGNDELRRMRGNRVALVSQDSLSALHPYYTIGAQLIEAVRSHHQMGRQAARALVLSMLQRVGIPDAGRRIDQYPHEFSGGMRQRAIIAMALVNNPQLIIADEPTTALDVTVQAQILDLLAELQREFGMAILMVTHDLGVAAEIADDVLVMYAGRAAEYGPVADIFQAPHHPYTWGLLGSMPRNDRPRTKRLNPITGLPPSLIELPPGCAFHPRCAFASRVADDACRRVIPIPDHVSTEHLVSCLMDPSQRREAFLTEIQPRREGTSR